MVDDKLFVTGGYNNPDERLDTTEWITLTDPSSSSITSMAGPNLLYAVVNHCLLQTGDTQLFLIGGRTDASTNTSLTMFLDFDGGAIAPGETFTSIVGPPLLVERNQLDCAIMDTDIGRLIFAMGIQSCYL